MRTEWEGNLFTLTSEKKDFFSSQRKVWQAEGSLPPLVFIIWGLGTIVHVNHPLLVHLFTRLLQYCCCLRGGTELEVSLLNHDSSHLPEHFCLVWIQEIQLLSTCHSIVLSNWAFDTNTYNRKEKLRISTLPNAAGYV